MPIKVAIVEDDVAVCEGLAFLIHESRGFECVAAYHTAEEALLRLPSRNPDVVLMDIELPGMSGITCIQRLKEICPRIQIMVLTVFDNPDRIFGSLAAGACGYLVKKTPPAKLLQAIRDLHLGGSPMSAEIARRVIEAFREPEIEADNLSVRERQVLEYVVRGYSYKEIAAELDVAPGTVRAHIQNIYKALQVNSRMEAILRVFPRRAHHRPPTN